MKKETIRTIQERLHARQFTEDQWHIWRQDERKGVQRALRAYERQVEKMRLRHERYEQKCQFDDAYGTHVAGVDEAGRGPLAGPVVTAAVILDVTSRDALQDVDDSKALTKEKRSALATLIRQHALAYTIDFASSADIDASNIYVATQRSMERAVHQLSMRPAVVLTDAMPLTTTSIPTHSIVKGDAKSLAIAAASILAKTARDHYMERLHERYPQYGFHEHAGYGTKQHIAAIEQYGIIEEHRRTFEPIRSLLE